MTTSTSSPPPSSRPARAARLALLVLVVLAWYPALSAGFFRDDFARIVDNPGIRRVWPPWRHLFDPATLASEPALVQFRPAVPLVDSLDYALAGPDPRRFHATNLLLHLLCVQLLFSLARAALADSKEDREALLIPFLASALFALHPSSGVVVAYVDARSTSLATAATMATLLLHGHAVRRDPARAWPCPGALLALAAGLAAKETAAVLPALAWLWDRRLRAEPAPARPAALRAAAYGALVVGFLAWGALVGAAATGNTLVHQGPVHAGPLEFLRRSLEVHLYVYLAAFARPVLIRICPWVDLHGPFGARHGAGLAVVILSLVLAARLRRSRPVTAFAILAYWIALAPTSSLLPLLQPADPTRPYLSGAFLALSLAALVPRGLPAAARLLPAILVLALVAREIPPMIEAWSSKRAIWAHCVEWGGNHEAWQCLAETVADPASQLVLYDRAVHLEWNNFDAHLRLAVLRWCELGDRKEARREFTECLAWAPTRARARYWLAVLDDLEAGPGTRSPAHADPDPDPDTARRLLVRGRLPDALLPLEDLARAFPGDPLHPYYLGGALQAFGQPGAAIAPFARALQGLEAGAPTATPLEPEQRLALARATRLALALALVSTGRCVDARPLLEKAARLAPGDPTVAQLAARCP